MVPPAPLLSCAGDQASRGVLPLAPPAASREAGNHVKFSHSLLTVLYPVASEWRPRLPHRSVPKPRVTHTRLPVGPSPPSSTRGVCLQTWRCGCFNTSAALWLPACCAQESPPSLGPLALGVWLHHPSGRCVCVCGLPTAHPTRCLWKLVSGTHLSVASPFLKASESFQ